jgi:branched-chain amino acid transport system substrate-binding protein
MEIVLRTKLISFQLAVCNGSNKYMRGKKMSKRAITTTLAVVAAVACLLVGIVAGFYAYPMINPSVSQQQYNAAITELNNLKNAGLKGQISLGFLASLTGDLATYGENEYEAAKFAAIQVNEYLSTIGANWTIAIVVEDTQTKPDVCLEKVESFNARGIKLLIGPLSSGEVRAIKGYIDTNKIMIISQSSTAPDLSIADDYVFRFCPTDRLGQGPALARLLTDEGKKYVVPLARNDAWGIGLQDAFETRFAQLGGTLLEGVAYAPEATEFTTEISNLASKVQSAVATYGSDNVAVLDISFGEVVSLMDVAKQYPALETVKWYGTDGTALEGSILTDANAREFALSVQYPSTIFAPTHSPKWEVVRQHNLVALGREPESYSYGVYDIVWAYAMSLLAVNQYNATAVKEVLPAVTNTLFGASGWIELDEFGDRKAGDYDVWQIVQVSPGTYDWKHQALWVYATDTIQRD